MIKSYGKTSNGELAAHEENVVSFLYADERYLDSVEDAVDYFNDYGPGQNDRY